MPTAAVVAAKSEKEVATLLALIEICHLAIIAVEGRLKWQEEIGYGRRSLVETTMGRYKAIIGPQLRARSLSGQRTEAMMGVLVLDRMLHAGRQKSVRSVQKNA